MSMVLCYAWELSNFTIVPTLQGFAARLIWKRAPQGPSAPEDKECPWRRILKRCYKTITEVEILELFQHQGLRLIFGIQLQDVNVWVFWKGEGNSEPDTHFLYCRNNMCHPLYPNHLSHCFVIICWCIRLHCQPRRGRHPVLLIFTASALSTWPALSRHWLRGWLKD